MPLLYYIQNSIISILLIGILLWYVMGQGGKRQAQDSIFIGLIFCALSIVISEFAVDILSGRAFSGSRVLLSIFAFGLYMGNLLLGVLYLLYLDQLRRRWVKIPRDMGILVFVPAAIACILCFMSIFNGRIFYIDADNLYHRGPLIQLVNLIAYGYFTIGVAYLLLYRSSFRHRSFSFLLFFPFPILIGSLLQLRFYGIEVAGISMVLTLLIVFFYMQNTQANRDYLTSLYNRKISDQYFNNLINHRKQEQEMAGILMDINSFKLINDTYGHDLGDTCLRYFSRILSETFKNGWFIARYGGDEFFLLKENSDQQDLDKALANFYEQLALFNTKYVLPFALSASVGSALCGPIGIMDGPSFIKSLDDQMYEDKRAYYASINKGVTINQILQATSYPKV